MDESPWVARLRPFAAPVGLRARLGPLPVSAVEAG